MTNPPGTPVPANPPNNNTYYSPLSYIINVFLSVLFALSFREFYTILSAVIDKIILLANQTPDTMELIKVCFSDKECKFFECNLAKIILVSITVVFFINDGIDGQLLTINNYPYKRLRRFYIDLMIYNSFFISIFLIGKLSKFYFLVIAFIFVLFYYWTKYTLEEYPKEKDYNQLILIIKKTCFLGFSSFLAFFLITVIFTFDSWLKLSIYTVLILLNHYFITLKINLRLIMRRDKMASRLLDLVLIIGIFGGFYLGKKITNAYKEMGRQHLKGLSKNT